MNIFKKLFEIWWKEEIDPCIEVDDFTFTELEDNPEAFDIKLGLLLFDQFYLPYTISHILEMIEHDYNYKNEMRLGESFRRLEEKEVINIYKGHIWCQGTEKSKKYLGLESLVPFKRR